MFERIKVKKLNDHIYLLDDNGDATGYLVVGSKKALVIDTMNGYENVYDVVRTMTDLPLMVVNTHGHCDHIFGNVYFDEAYMNPDDNEVAKEHMAFSEFVERCKEHKLSMPPFKPIKELLPAFLEAGGKLKVCSACMKHNGVEEDSLVEGAEIINADYVVDAIMEAKKSLQLN